MYIFMHKEACAVIPHKNLAEFKLPFSTKCHSHYRELQFKKLTGLKIFFSIHLTGFLKFFKPSYLSFWNASISLCQISWSWIGTASVRRKNIRSLQSRSWLLLWINLMLMTFIRTSVCVSLAKLQRLHVHTENQREPRFNCMMGFTAICQNLLVKESHKTKRPAITSNNDSHQHITPIPLTAHHINTDFFTGTLKVTSWMLDKVLTLQLMQDFTFNILQWNKLTLFPSLADMV